MALLDSILGGANDILQAPNANTYAQQFNNQNIAQQGQLAQTANAQQDLMQKRRSMALSMLNGVQDEDTYSKLAPLIQRYDPTLKLPEQYDPAMVNAVRMGNVPTVSLPEYQMMTQQAAMLQALRDRLVGGQNPIPQQNSIAQPIPNNSQAIQPNAQSALSTGIDPSTMSLMAAVNPAMATAMTNVQKLQYESPEGKQAISEAEKTGGNIAETGKTLKVMQANLPVVLQRLKEMRDASENASYGFGVNNEGSGIKQQAANQFNTEEAKPNTILEQRAAQGVLPELGPQLAQAGIKGNKFLETLASSASGVNLGASPEAKKEQINGLEEQYINNLKSTARQARAYGDPSAPTDDQIDAMVNQYKGNPGNAITVPQNAAQQAQQMISKAPKVGTISKGYVYLGGDPSKPESWKSIK